jgi:hypothetical protein
MSPGIVDLEQDLNFGVKPAQPQGGVVNARGEPESVGAHR